ncbi:MAG: hypothetical protein ABIK15_12350 [Pseudomonadota bacterium]
MYKIFAVCLVCLAFFLPASFASEKAVTIEQTHELSDHESKMDARRICFLKAKKKLLTETVDFFLKQKTGEIAMLARKDMEQYVLVLLEIDAKSEKWEYSDNHLSVNMTVESIFDPAALEKKILSLHQDDELKKKIQKDQDRLQTLENEYMALEKQLALAKEETVVSLRKESQVISSEIDRIENVRYLIESGTKLASDKITTGMTIDEVITIAGQPRASATCEKPDFLNYGNIWIWLNNGIVIGKIPMEKWSGPCYRYSFSDREEKNDTPSKEAGSKESTEKANFIISLKSGQTIYTSTYQKVNDVIYYKKYGGIVGIEEEKVDTIREIE